MKTRGEERRCECGLQRNVLGCLIGGCTKRSESFICRNALLEQYFVPHHMGWYIVRRLRYERVNLIDGVLDIAEIEMCARFGIK